MAAKRNTAAPTAKPEPAPRQGRKSLYVDPDPWPDPIDGAALLDELAALFEHYLALPHHASTVLALWVVFTYVFGAARISPRLLITSPVRECGKTTLMTLLASLVWRPCPTSNISPPTLFRMIDAERPTVLIDEGDSVPREQHDSVRNILNSGHTRAFAYTDRCVGDSYEPRRFSTWAPIAYARIGLPRGKDATITSRSISIELQRKTEADKVAHLRADRIHADCFEVRRRLARWAADNEQAISALDPDPPFLNRAGDNWRPLLAIAAIAGRDWPARARAAALALSAGQDPADSDDSTMLLLDVEQAFADAGNPDRLPTDAILKALNARDDRRWGDWNAGTGLTDRDLADRLRGFKIRPVAMKVDGRSVRGYYRADFEEAWRRYRINSEAPTSSPSIVAAVAPPSPGTATEIQPVKLRSVAVVAAVTPNRGRGLPSIVPLAASAARASTAAVSARGNGAASLPFAARTSTAPAVAAERTSSTTGPALVEPEPPTTTYDLRYDRMLRARGRA